ncbi:MAG: sigma-70 family RNA polymerase sigma factor [Candidatus Omnitrophica bacterium]|nr:sigma-70 family RNA polymerase sigma factor [Candidatus Omnitrophota bacterium]
MEAIRAYIEKIKDIPLLSAEEEKKLARLARRGNKKAQERLINSNLKLVVNIAKRYTHFGLPLMDLIEEGNIGLIKAVEKYYPSKGYRFSTYAAWWIRQAITRALIDKSRTIRIPVYMSELISKYKKAENELTQRLGYKPSRKELAQKLKFSQKKVAQIQMWFNKKLSLNLPLGDETHAELVDVIEDESSSLEDINQFFLREKVKDMLDSLEEREKEVINLRFGITTGKPETLAEVAKKFKISRERVRQIEERALKKLREYAEARQEESIIKEV